MNFTYANSLNVWHDAFPTRFAREHFKYELHLQRQPRKNISILFSVVQLFSDK